MSVIKENKEIKEALLKRLKELYPSNIGFGFKNSMVVKDAEERGVKIAAEQISRYFSPKQQKNTLSEEQIIWLCFRYGITIRINIGEPVVRDGKLYFEVPKFDELKALQDLKRIYGK